MALKDFLKKIFPFEINLLKIENLYYTKYDQDIETYIEKVKKLTIEDKSNVLGYVRSDLLETEAELISPEKEFKRYIDEFEPYMSDDDHGALITASAVIKLERKGKNELAGRILKSLSNAYPIRGKKIYNLLESGYFEQYIYPKLKKIKREFKDDEIRIKGAFLTFFEGVMRYFKYAIWVSETTSLKDIEIGLLQRLSTLKQPMVFIHTRGEKNIKKLDEVIEIFMKNYEKKYNCEMWDYTLRGAKAKTAIVVSKKAIEKIIKKSE